MGFSQAFLEKLETKLILDHFGLVLPIFEHDFFQKIGLCQLDFRTFYHHAKKEQKKLMRGYQEKLLTYRHRDDGNLIEPSVYEGPIQGDISKG